MNVYYVLETLGERIKDVFPKLSDVTAKSDQERIIQKSTITDIQRRFAEIYAIIEREISNEELNLDYKEALIKFPARIKSILNLISVLALAIKTKLNINNAHKVFTAEYINRMDNVCFQCYKIQLTLSGTANANANEVYRKGISKAYTYEDYKTGYKKTMSPGFIQGQLTAFGVHTPGVVSQYSSMVTNAIELLDPNGKVPSISERSEVLFSYRPTGSCAQGLLVQERRNPKTLFQSAVNVLIKNRDTEFKNLTDLPTAITDRVPELDINYKHKFCVAVEKIIAGISFSPSPKEKEYLDKLSSALTTENPFNAVHPILEEIKSIYTKAFLSEFKTHMQPIKDEIASRMRQYNTDKQEYVKHFGKTL